jgi:hypothetical protein
MPEQAPELRHRVATLRVEFERLQTAVTREVERAQTEAAKARVLRRRRWTVRYERALARKIDELSDIKFD